MYVGQHVVKPLFCFPTVILCSLIALDINQLPFSSTIVALMPSPVCVLISDHKSQQKSGLAVISVQMADRGRKNPDQVKTSNDHKLEGSHLQGNSPQSVTVVA